MLDTIVPFCLKAYRRERCRWHDGNEKCGALHLLPLRTLTHTIDDLTPILNEVYLPEAEKVGRQS